MVKEKNIFFIPDSNKISADLSHFSEINMILVFAIHERAS